MDKAKTLVQIEMEGYKDTELRPLNAQKRRELAKQMQRKWVSTEDVVEFSKAVMERLKIAEEKNEEYAKLVTAQAKEYAEKLEGKILIDRKKLEDHVQRFPERGFCFSPKELKELLASSGSDKPK